MMQFASDGQWGRGLYFAEDAGYSHFYATAGSGFNKPPPGSHDAQLGELRADELELLCCDLLLGSVAEMDRDYGQDKTACPGIETEMRVVCGGKGGKGGLKTPPFVNAKPPVRCQHHRCVYHRSCARALGKLLRVSDGRLRATVAARR